MTRIFRVFAVTAMVVAALLSLTGCYSAPVDDLYSLPKSSEKNVMLQNLINEEIAGGSEFSAPTRGGYRQSVQQYDIDGDGVDETFAFFMNSEKSLTICVYTGNGGNNAYSLAATIKGEGTSIGTIEYADVDGDGVADLIVEWQSGTGSMRLLQAFAMRGFEAASILTVNCAEFRVSDFTGDGVSDVAVMRYDITEESDTPTGEIELYSFTDDGELISSGGMLSRGLGQGTVSRMRTGLLSDMTPALFVEGTYGENELITDIFAYNGEAFRNITIKKPRGVSEDTIRLNYREPYSQDIDKDRALETPEIVPMHVQENTSPVYYFDWYSYDADGVRTLDLSTYHSSDGWYLILPEAWKNGLTVRRGEGSSTGERAIILSSYDERTGGVTDFLVIYTLTGDNRRDRARIPERFTLLDDDATIYAARILRDESEWTHALSPDEIRDNFKLIYSEWTTGAI